MRRTESYLKQSDVIRGIQYALYSVDFSSTDQNYRAEKLVPNIELETFDYTGRNMKKKSPSVPREEEVKVAVDQGSSKKEVNECEVEGLCMRFSRMRSTEKSSLIQVSISELETIHNN